MTDQRPLAGKVAIVTGAAKGIGGVVSDHLARDGADVALERSETRAFVRAQIDKLPDTYRTVLLLRDIEELSTSEVAAMLSTSENAVKIRLHRARQALRALLDERFGRPALDTPGVAR